MEVAATSRYLRIAPRKARLVTDQLKGLGIGEAFSLLAYLPNRSAAMIAKTIKSAVANAENNYGLNPESLYVARAFVDDGPRLRRMRAKSRGRGGVYRRRMCHITVVVDEIEA